MKCVNIFGLTKPLAGLLGRLKSLRPDLVPYTVPYQSSALCFHKAPSVLRTGLYTLSERIKEQNEQPGSMANLFEGEQQRVSSLFTTN